MNESTADRTVSLRSKEGTLFHVSMEAVCISQLIRETLLDEHGPDNIGCVIELTRISNTCLEQVVQFMEHYAKEPMIPISTPIEQLTLDTLVPQEWYRTFISSDTNSTFQIVAAANFMAIQPLLDLVTLYISLNIMGKSAEDIRIYLKLPTLSKEEEELARRDFPWILLLD